MTDVLFTPIPVEGDPIAMPNGVTVPARQVTEVLREGQTIITLGIEWDGDLPLGAFYGLITVDAFGTITSTLDGLRPCPYSVGDQL